MTNQTSFRAFPTHAHPCVSRLFQAAVPLAAFLLAACAPSPRDHYVKSAEARIAAVPLVPALNLPEDKERLSLALNGSYQDPVSLRLPVRAMTAESPSPEAQAFRGRYDVRQARYAFGFEMRETPFTFLDWFVTARVGGEMDIHAAALAGIGVTLPLPWLSVRVAPSLGLHGYTNRTVDSTITTHKNVFFPSIVTRDTTVYRQSNSGFAMGPVRAISVSVWPAPNPDRVLTPYLQYQAHWAGVSANDSDNVVPDRIIALRGHAFAAGLDYRIGPTLSLGARAVRETIANGFGSSTLHRIESSLAFRIVPPQARR